MSLNLLAEDVSSQLREQVGSIALDAADLALGGVGASGITLTKSQMLALLANVADDMPLIVYSSTAEDYMNLELDATILHEQVADGAVTIALLARGDFDTRQW